MVDRRVRDDPAGSRQRAEAAQDNEISADALKQKEKGARRRPCTTHKKRCDDRTRGSERERGERSEGVLSGSKVCVGVNDRRLHVHSRPIASTACKVLPTVHRPFFCYEIMFTINSGHDLQQ